MSICSSDTNDKLRSLQWELIRLKALLLKVHVIGLSKIIIFLNSDGLLDRNSNLRLHVWGSF